MKEPNHLSNDELIAVLTGEYSPEEASQFRRHLEACPSCRTELAQLQEVWQSLAFDVDEFEPPADLKQQVLNACVDEEKEAVVESASEQRPRLSGPTRQPSLPVKRRLTFRWIHGLTAALFVLVVGMFIWNLQLQQQVTALPADSEEPNRIVKWYTLQSFAVESQEAQGMACIVENGDRRNLVVYLWNLEESPGDEVYQVWLLNDGKRTSAGSFDVGQSGLGVLTLNLSSDTDAIDQIGITLEPDAGSNEPRGKKVLGT